MNSDGQFRPERLPIEAKVFAGDGPGRDALDRYASLDGHGPLSLHPLIDGWGLNAQGTRERRLAPELLDRLENAWMGGSALLSHRLIVRSRLTSASPQQSELPHGLTSGLNKAMLTGKELGKAIRLAVDLKGVRLADVARHFGVKPPSVQDWINKGTIDKGRLPALWLYFSDVVGPEHWGLTSFPQARVVGGLFEEITDRERRLLDDFRLLPDEEQDAHASEIAQRAAFLRAYLNKQLPRLQSQRNQTDSALAEKADSGSTDEAKTRPAELFGIDDLSASGNKNASGSKDYGDSRSKNRRRA